MKRKLLFSTAFLFALLFSASAGVSLQKKSRDFLNVLPNGNVRNEMNVPSKSPIQKATITSLPYFYSFETTDISTDGWLLVDPASLGKTVASTSAPYGDYYLRSNYSTTAARNLWAFSPSVALTAGTTYYVSIYVYAPGYSGTNDEFKLTVGSAQDATTQTTIIIDKTGANATAYADWTLVTGSFTASADGDYFFGINHCTAAIDVDLVAFDAFAVSANTAFVYPPSVKVTEWGGGLWSATSTTDKIYLSPGESLTYTANATNTTGYQWNFGDATPSTSTNSQETIVFNSEGDKSVNLVATGNGGSTTSTINLNVTRPADNLSDIVWNILPDDAITYLTISTNNYLAGINGYYRRIAEKYTLPSSVTVSLKSIDFYVAKYTMSATNRAKNVVINVYQAGADGLPGTVLGTYTTTFGTLFGTSSITSATEKIYSLATPLSITGSFFIEINMSANTTTASTTNNFSLYSSAERAVPFNTGYVYYNSTWMPLSDSSLFGSYFSYGILPTLNFISPLSGIGEKSNNDLGVSYSKNELNVNNAKAGSAVNVTDLTGKVVYSTAISNTNSSYSVGLQKGIYIVKVGNKSTKLFVK